MAVRPVLLVPDPRLKSACAQVKEFGAGLRRLIRDLEDTMRANAGCVGIAACQIGRMQRVAIVDTSGHRKHGAASQGRHVLINARITRQAGERIGREGCLSLPDFTANVRRAAAIDVAFFGQDGQPGTLTAIDFEAVAIQHELDHLDGILFLDRVANLHTDVFRRRNVHESQ